MTCISGIAHPKTVNGVMINHCYILNDKRKPELAVWKLTAEKPFYREMIAQIPININGY